jgi:hypothetical protein
MAFLGQREAPVRSRSRAHPGAGHFSLKDRTRWSRTRLISLPSLDNTFELHRDELL